MISAQPGTADIQHGDHERPVMAVTLEASTDLVEMDIDPLREDSQSCYEGSHLDRLPSEEEDRIEGDEAGISDISQYLSISSQPVSSSTITCAPAHARRSTPISPEYEDLISDEDEIESEPLSPFEALPTEVSL